MFKAINILDEKDKRVRAKNSDITFPLKREYKDLIHKSIKHLTYSQLPEYEEKYNLRPGMGVAFPQLGINKNIIIIVYEVDEGIFDEYVFINPKIVSTSEEMIACEMGEGCLSVEREVEGHVARHARITIEGYDMDGKKIRVRAREELAVAFQHEIDHLNGILFFDRIDKKKPFFTETEIRLI